MSRTSPARRSRKLGLERLDDRRVMASINVIGGVLTVVGDSTADEISINSYDPYTVANVVISDRTTGTVKLTASPNMATFTSTLVQGLGGDDLINYSLFKDSTLEGGDGNDTIDGYEAGDILRGGAGNDTLRSHGGIDVLEGGADQDTLQGGSGPDDLFGGDGDDTLEGGTGDDDLFGQSGNDRYRFAGANLGSDRIDNETAAQGSDTLDFSGMPTPVFVGLDNFGLTNISSGLNLWLASPETARIENIVGSEHGDWLIGDDRANILSGLGGDDIIAALDGSDTLDGGFGDDILRGGYGADRYAFAGSGNLGSDTIDEGTVNTAPGDPLHTLPASMFPGDTLDFSGLDSPVGVQLGDYGLVVSFSVGSPLDTIGGWFEDLGEWVGGLFNFASSAAEAQVEVMFPEQVIENAIGTRFDDLLIGSYANNRLEGRGGNDQLEGGLGNDTLAGGGGDDKLQGYYGYDTYLFHEAGSLGHDTIYDSGSDGRLDFSQFGRAVTVYLDRGARQTVHADLDLTLQSSTMLNDVVGSALADIIYGNSLDNNLNGLGGDDTIHGQGGDDTITGGDGRDRLFGDGGNDWLYADLVDLVVDGGTGTNTIYGRPRIALPVGR